MVTGDDVAIGSEIAKQLGMGDHLLVASDVFKDGTDPDHIPLPCGAAVERADGFGRVFPQHKYEIVKACRSAGHLVAMTGDGVNDAPALKQADCGMAVSGATDAARSAAALILTAPGLSTIVNAIVECAQDLRAHHQLHLLPDRDDARHHVPRGRCRYVFFGFQPLTAIMIVALALLDDIPIMTIAYDNVRRRRSRCAGRCTDPGVLVAHGPARHRPELRARADRHGMDERSRADGAVPARPCRSLQTMMFLQLAAGGHLLLFVVRTRRSVFEPPFPAAPLFLAIVATQVVAVADVRLRHPGAAAALGGDRRGLALRPALDGRARHRQAALLSRIAGRPRRSAAPACTLADRGGGGDVNFTQEAARRARDARSGSRIRPRLSRQARRTSRRRAGARAAIKLEARRLQRKIYGDNRHSLLIVLQGHGRRRQGRHLLARGQRHGPARLPRAGLQAPTPREHAHDFLWRVHPHAPAKGEVAVFNRSHYEDVLVARVHKLVPKKVWEARYQLINDWERLLHEENGTTILKFFLVVSKEEQLARFAAPPRRPAAAVEDQRRRLQGARLLRRLSRRLRRGARSGPRPSTRPGSRSPATTNGSATSPWPRSCWMRFRR